MSSSLADLYIPDFMADWPWPRRIHPLYEEVAAESNEWLRSFVAFTPASQAAFEKCDFGRLASLAYPDASRDHLRTGVDLMNVFFIIDEYTDVEPAPVVREMIDAVIDAVHNPYKPRPAGETILGEVVRQFAERAFKTATPEAVAHFLESFTDYVRSVVTEAEDRCNGTLLSIDEFIKIRRENNGGRPSLSPCELHLNLPDEAFYHPHIVEMRTCIVDMITIINDVMSYNREQATENDHYNLLTIVRRNLNVDFDTAMAWVVDFHKSVSGRFLEGLKNVPSFSPEVDAQLQEYLQSIANWPRCLDSWSFESKRYFGERGLEVQRTRHVPLLPRRKPEPVRQGDIQVHIIEALARPIAV
ncbi:terpenoid synthase [Trametes coccinea BRFM310]|uniref:Terpene synthase n=1 Tax=Trametes coccinea (strain BRFM310) TaxID=1353009 RepID=A0A1Y2IBZ2_TRAC3|nr:terpenoid synthase [Trametes coccinea BRFM310]